MAEVKLKMNGKPLDLNPPAPLFTKIKAFLDAAPADELFMIEQISAKLKFAVGSFGISMFGKFLNTYSARVGRYRYWGNPKAIQELVKQARP